MDNLEDEKVVDTFEDNENVNETLINADEITDTSMQEEPKKEVKEEVVEEEKKFTQKELNEILEKRIAREKRNLERENSKYKQIVKTVQSGMGEEDLDKVTTSLAEFYKEQGIEIPTIENERDVKILAKADALEIIEGGIDYMEQIANEIANKPENQRTTREKTIFAEVCASLVLEKSKSELEKNGIDTSIIDNDDFKNFSKQFNPSTSIVEIHKLYSKINQPVIEKPKSTGSVKTTSTDDTFKEYYTPEEARLLTDKDYDNPRIMKAVENSMTKWEKH